MGPPGASRSLFDLWSRFYDATLVQWLVYRPVHEAVLRAIGATGRLLDVGCGTGQLATRIDRERTAQVVGCDFSFGMLRQATSRNLQVDWVQGDALHLPFRDASFDAVVSTETFHWLPDQQTVLAELARVIAPGGRLVVAGACPPVALVSSALRLGSWVVGQPGSWPTPRQMREQVEAAGLRVEAQTRIGRLPGALLLPAILTVAVRPA